MSVELLPDRLMPSFSLHMERVVVYLGKYVFVAVTKVRRLGFGVHCPSGVGFNVDAEHYAVS